MKISDVKRYYVQHSYTDEQKGFTTLTSAVKYVIEKKDHNLLIHIGGYNLDSYNRGDSFETLYNRCVNTLASI
jgi:hypothetical protein